MSVKYLRSYFGTTLKTLDKEFREHEDAFNTENIGELRLDKAYHVGYGSMNNLSFNQGSSTDEYTITVSLFSKTNRDTISSIDEAMDFANQYRMKCVDPKNIMEAEKIIIVKFDQMVPEFLNGNDNAVVIRLTFRCVGIFGFGENLNCEC